ncbi:TylF/MycF/NovP-related O-methyltransferase [Polycladidibacter stylochi]|uniref:TylF/MycF/NovP-related O-methyltransferase n=1 Tax=Polycladidibacter stylochi TaxID=1807766 RepID=UPI00082F374D|nr:TylF/MycF/NovP-related O-methyltransferase [Pseudovibrio stylochi]
MACTREIQGLDKNRSWDYENGFYWFSSKSRLNKALAHYELYKTIINKPGDILEFGVFKAASLIRFANYRDALENDYSRRIVGFDTFADFPKTNLDLKSDLEFIKFFEEVGGDGLTVDEISGILANKGFENIELVKGNVFDTLTTYLKQKPETRIALLHLDMDVKEPTELALELLYERVVPGGLIVLDDYGIVAGATEAVDALIKHYRLQLEKLPFYMTPTFIRKPL